MKKNAPVPKSQVSTFISGRPSDRPRLPSGRWWFGVRPLVPTDSKIRRGASHVSTPSSGGLRLEEHEFLLDAMEAQDAEKAASIMASHLRHVRGAWAGGIETPQS
ncbi:FCD domain-containing protein [Sinomonas mesophila]|uniref:FCD domain-containing protein n=1 Tax=Sinomonas mesophila TaxID=1531955 RepID=UPI001C37C994